jgi:hypothetical protein
MRGLRGQSTATQTVPKFGPCLRRREKRGPNASGHWEHFFPSRVKSEPIRTSTVRLRRTVGDALTHYPLVASYPYLSFLPMFVGHLFIYFHVLCSHNCIVYSKVLCALIFTVIFRVGTFLFLRKKRCLFATFVLHSTKKIIHQATSWLVTGESSSWPPASSW